MIKSIFFTLGVAAAAAPATTLQPYNVDPNSVSVSGMSSGGFMTAQLAVAYSGTFKAGFGVFAGGPYDCARDQGVSCQQPLGTTQSWLIQLAGWLHKSELPFHCPAYPQYERLERQQDRQSGQA